MKSQQDICEQFDVKPVEFITFHALKVSMNIFLREQLDICEHESNDRPYYPKSLRLLLKSTKGTTSIKKVFNTNKTVFFNEKWSKDLDIMLG